MTIAIRLILAIIIGAAAWAAASALPQVPPVVLFIVAAVAAALLPTANASASDSTRAGDGRTSRPEKTQAAVEHDGPREEGSVKWFNVSKGFGFITKDDGDEIFVHFRSIRGEGRRALRDGQRVSFVEAQTDKGPQAEDVEPL